MNIFVGNLSFESTESDVKKLFEDFGVVTAVVIVKEKKGDKSRGFGFVTMADEPSGQLAIAALNGREFMGRALNVNPARPKTEEERSEKQEKKARLKHMSHGDAYEETPARKPGFDQAYEERGGYKGGRRSRSFMRRSTEAGSVQEFKPRKTFHDNPMRWRKRSDQRSWKRPTEGAGFSREAEGNSKVSYRSEEGSKPWKKSAGDSRPWKAAAGEARPWKKRSSDARPWKKAEGESRPWKAGAGEARPWKKRSADARPWKKAEGEARPWKAGAGEARPWRRPEGDFKPWKKSSGSSKPWKGSEPAAKPWKKPDGGAKPWHAKSDRPRKPGLKGRGRPGSFKR